MIDKARELALKTLYKIDKDHAYSNIALNDEIKQRIMDISDLLIICSNQGLNSIKKLQKCKEENPILQSSKSMFLVGKYDKFSKYNAKNITRFLNEKNPK